MDKMGRVFVVDDEPELMETLCDLLNEKDFDACGFTSPADALKALREQDVDLLLTELMMPGTNGIELLQEALRIDPNVAGIMITGEGTIETAVSAMKVGAYDFILKPFTFDALLAVILRTMEMRRLKNENLQLRESVAIYDLAMAVSATLDTGIILNELARAVTDHCRADAMSVMLLITEDEMQVAFARGRRDKELVGRRVPVRQGIAGWVALNRETLILQDGFENARFVPAQIRPEIKASISLPLLAGGKCFGVLNVNSKKRRSFLLGELRALKILASVAAAALKNAWLHDGLRESEKRYRRIVETATEGIWALDQSARTVYLNQRMAEMLACDVKEVMGRPLSEFLDREQVVEVNECLKRRGQYEIKFRRQNGQDLWAILSANPFFEGPGQYAGALAMITDITERKRLEKEMTRLDRLHLVGEMAAGIGHEIRNPITTVRGFLQYLGEKDDCTRYKEHYELMIQELDRANAIITEYLSLAKTKLVDLTIQNLNSIIKAVFPLIQSRALQDDKGVELRMEACPPLKLNEKEIRQLLLNLVHNGLEAMPAGGCLTIGTYPEGRDVVLSVQDQGPGIEPVVLEKIGTPFVTTKDHGTGLGLAVCYSIAARHNAVIDVRTGCGGTTFLIRFRRPDAESDESPAPAAPA